MNQILANSLALATPEIVLVIGASIVLIVDVFLNDAQRGISYLLALATLVVTAVFVAALPEGRNVGFTGMFVVDGIARFLKLVACGSVAAVFLYSRDYLRVRGLFRGEYFVLALFATLGIFVIVSAGSLLSMYMGIEVLALSQYALVAFDRDSSVAAESAMKYFVLGAIASGLLLYGISIVYGVTGTFDLASLAVHTQLGAGTNVGVLFGLAFIVAGIAFKFGAVPFHMWVPDVYQGAPTAVTLLIGGAPKLAAFAITLRLLVEGMITLAVDWQQMLLVLALVEGAWEFDEISGVCEGGASTGVPTARVWA